MSGQAERKHAPEAETGTHARPASAPEQKDKKVLFYTAKVHELIDSVINGSGSSLVRAVREACKKGKVDDVKKSIKREEYIDPESALRICDAINKSKHFGQKERDTLQEKVLKHLKFQNTDERSVQGIYAIVGDNNKKDLAKEMQKVGISLDPPTPAAAPAAVTANTAATTHTAPAAHAPEASPAPHAATPHATPTPATSTAPAENHAAHATPHATPHATVTPHTAAPAPAPHAAPQAAAHAQVTAHAPAANDNTEGEHPAEEHKEEHKKEAGHNAHDAHDDHGHPSYLLKAVNFIGDKVAFVYDEISPFIEKTVNITANVATGILSLDFFKEGFEIASDATVSVTKGVGGIVGGFATNAKDVITWPFKGIGRIWDRIKEGAKNRKEKRAKTKIEKEAAAGTASEKKKNIFRRGWDGLIGLFKHRQKTSGSTEAKKSSFGAGLKTGIKNIGSSIGSGFKRVGNGIVSVGRSIGSGIASGWRKFTGLFKRNKKTS